MDNHRFAQEPIQEALPALMTERGVTFRELAAATNLSAGYLNHIAHGERPVPADDVLARIASALDVEIDYFLEARIRVITAALETHPQIVARLYRQLAAKPVLETVVTP